MAVICSPTLFVTIACGAVSGFHSLVSSGTSSKTISNEKDMPMVGYGAMVVESLLGVIALVVVGAVAVNGTKPEGTPFSIFSAGVAGFFRKIRYSGTGCYRIYDDVCICTGTDLSILLHGSDVCRFRSCFTGILLTLPRCRAGRKF